MYGIARALADLSDRARKGTLKGAEMQGGCFTVSSLGGIGGTAFTPIINAPEVAILGVSRTQTKPVWQDGKRSCRARCCRCRFPMTIASSTARWARASPCTWRRCWPIRRH